MSQQVNYQFLLVNMHMQAFLLIYSKQGDMVLWNQITQDLKIISITNFIIIRTSLNLFPHCEMKMIILSS